MVEWGCSNSKGMKLIKYIRSWFRRKKRCDKDLKDLLDSVIDPYIYRDVSEKLKPLESDFIKESVPTFSFGINSPLTVNDMLEEAVANEDYERAAELRDLIKAENDIHSSK